MRFLIFLVGASLCVAQSLAIRNVTVVDVATGRTRVATVLTKGKKITGVAAGLRVPVGSTSVDGTGKFLIPGLWDMHVHLWEKEPMLGLYVANGVTGIRDMGSDYVQTNRWREESMSGKRVGPALIYTSGAPVDGMRGVAGTLPVRRVEGPEQARVAVDELDQSGVDFIKTMSSLSRDEYESVAQRARVRRIPFAGHVPEEVTLENALDLRQRSMEHLYGMVFSFSPLEASLRGPYLKAMAGKRLEEATKLRLRAVETYSEPQASVLFRRMITLDVAQCPTLTMLRSSAGIGIDELPSDVRGKSVPAVVLANWADLGKERKKVTEERKAALLKEWELSKRIVKQMATSGVTLLAGTDTGDPYVLPGFALHDELALLVDAGLTPLQALQTATLNPARFLGIGVDYGSVAVGKAANLVLLGANPLIDIGNTRKIAAVVLNGRLVDRKELDRLVSPQPR